MILYRLGSLTSDNFTPRAGKDTIGGPGQAAGLSMFEELVLASGRKAQAIDSERLRLPLKAIPDNPAEGGTEGHVAIAPIDAQGRVDQALLDEWASTRGTGQVHRLTQIVLDAIVEVDIRG